MKQTTLNRFGYEWSRFPSIIELYESQFLGWVSPPLAPGSFKGKSVLDAGCGTGRNSYWPLRYGASRVVACDVDPRTVAVAKTNLGAYAEATVRELSIYDLPFCDEFDIAYSIGVIHHLAEPKKAVAKLVQATKPEGIVLVWVYGHEGFTWLKNCINALRKVTCRLHPALLNVLVWPFSFFFFLYLKLYSGSHPYLQLLKPAKFWHVHSILFDQLLPEIAHYWTREEALSLFNGLPVKNVNIRFCNEGRALCGRTKIGTN